MTEARIPMTKEQVSKALLEISDEITALVEDREKRIDDANSQLENMKQATEGYISPDYGMLPVPAKFHEHILELAQQRGISPGVLMTGKVVEDHLELLILKELL